MNYIEHLSEPWFTEIYEGRKTIEGRKNKGRFANMKIGDVIKWYNEDDGYKFCYCIIVNIKKYNTFRDLLIYEGLQNCLPMVNDIEIGVSIYRHYYSEEDEINYGVLAIELSLIE